MPYCFSHWQINGLVPLSKNRRILIIVATFLSVWKVHLLLVLESLWREIPEFWPRVPGPLPGERIARHVSWRARQLHAVSTFTCAVLHSACLAVCRVSAFSCGHYITTGRENCAACIMACKHLFHSCTEIGVGWSLCAFSKSIGIKSKYFSFCFEMNTFTISAQEPDENVECLYFQIIPVLGHSERDLRVPLEEAGCELTG